MGEDQSGRPKCTIAGRLETVWELLTSQLGSGRWLGTRGSGDLRAGAPVVVGGRNGQVLEVRDGEHVVLLEWPEGGQVTLSFTPHEVTGGRASRVVRIEAAGVESEDHQVWLEALEAAQLAVVEARQQRDPRQAVILIHGIGEQLPGTTVRGFARGALGLDGDPNEPILLMKPDVRLEPRYEIFRVQAFKNAIPELPRTDFLEVYWQDLIRDTTWKQVKRWALSVAKGDLPPKLRALRRLIQATVLLLALAAAAMAVLLLLGLAQVKWPSWLRTGSTVITVGSALGSRVTGAISAWAVTSLGDAARYLQPLPDNVAVRRAIRERGVTLLRSLHDSGQYHRIVLVGHSLGSVMALDILCEFWWEVYLRGSTPPPDRLEAYRNALTDYEETAASLPGANRDETVATFREAQRRLWQAMRRAGMPWLVSDFVTLGSPIQYPWPFLASSQSDFESRKVEMLIPEVPARAEPPRDSGTGGITFETSYIGPAGPATIPVLNQAAVFAPTRWTNVAFPCRWWVFGDPVGGPVADWLGPGILDLQPAPRGRSWLSRHSPKLHSQYWTSLQPDALTMLREALDLSSLSSLQALARDFPLSQFLKPTPAMVTAPRKHGKPD